MRIDVHAHCFPAKYLDRLDRLGGSSTGTEFARRFAAGTSTAEIEARFALMEETRVDKQVLSVAPQFPYFTDARAAVEAACLANHLMANLAARHPTRFLAIGTLPLPHIDAAIAEAARCLDALGMQGVVVATSVLGRSVADRSFDPFFAELDRRKALLFLHPAGLACGSAAIAESNLTWPVGAPLEDAVAVLQLMQAGVPVRYPNMRIVVPHLGGFLPFLMKRLDHQAPWFLPSASEAPSALARRFWYDSVNSYPPALRSAVEAFGSSHILLGADFPYWRDGAYVEAVRYVANAGLSVGDSQRILDRNAAELFGVKPEN